MNEVGHYDIQCTDGFFGHLHGFIIDDQTQGIRYLVVNTEDFFPRKRVLISPGLGGGNRVFGVEGDRSS